VVTSYMDMSSDAAHAISIYDVTTCATSDDIISYSVLVT
jgi:hypothetical protein